MKNININEIKNIIEEFPYKEEIMSEIIIESKKNKGIYKKQIVSIQRVSE